METQVGQDWEICFYGHILVARSRSAYLRSPAPQPMYGKGGMGKMDTMDMWMSGTISQAGMGSWLEPLLMANAMDYDLTKKDLFNRGSLGIYILIVLVLAESEL